MPSLSVIASAFPVRLVIPSPFASSGQAPRPVLRSLGERGKQPKTTTRPALEGEGRVNRLLANTSERVRVLKHVVCASRRINHSIVGTVDCPGHHSVTINVHGC